MLNVFGDSGKSMSDEDFDRLVTRSSIYLRCQEEKASITRHQERIERDEQRCVDFDTALVAWMLKRRRNWLREKTQP